MEGEREGGREREKGSGGSTQTRYVCVCIFFYSHTVYGISEGPGPYLTTYRICTYCNIKCILSVIFYSMGNTLG